jgi:hypothetical protein
LLLSLPLAAQEHLEPRQLVQRSRESREPSAGSHELCRTLVDSFAGSAPTSSVIAMSNSVSQQPRVVRALVPR